MTTDDDRIGYLAGDPGPGPDLDPADAEGLDDLRALLADRSTWAEPDPGLEDRVVAAVSAGAETAAQARPSVTSPATARRPSRLGLVGALAAVAATIVVAVAVIGGGNDTGSRQLAVSLRPTALAPAAEGHASLTRTDSGWRIELDGTGLPRLDGDRFYQAWLRNGDGDLVPIGTFNEPADVTLWAGVSPDEYRTLTVTEEIADGDQASSGRKVLVGQVQP